MSFLKPVSHSDAYFQSLRGGKSCSGFQHVAQAAASAKIRNHIGNSVFKPPVVIRDDIGVRQPGGRLSFGSEAAQKVAVIGQLGTENFHSHRSVERGVLRPIHFARVALADQLEKLIPLSEKLPFSCHLRFKLPPSSAETAPSAAIR